MNIEKTLSSGNDLYAVDFYGKSAHIIFNGGETGTLGKLCVLYGEHGIVSIRRYNASKMKFDKISKPMISNIFMWDTETILELKKTGYIK